MNLRLIEHNRYKEKVNISKLFPIDTNPIGNRVIVKYTDSDINLKYPIFLIGLKGTIVNEITDFSEQIYKYGIKFDKYINGHGCDGKCKDGYGYYLPTTWVKFI